MSEECKKHRASPIVGPHDCPSCAMEKIRGVNYEVSVENQRLRAELAALKAGHGEAVAWRDHSVNYAKGEKCPATIETLQAAWDRDQELLLDQKNVISKLKETINQLRQKRTTPPATGQGEAVTEVSAETFSSDGTSDIITCNLPIGTKLYLSAPPASADTRLVPVELLQRIDGALTRHMNDHAPMRVPVDMTDSDIVQAELRALLAQSQEG